MGEREKAVVLVVWWDEKCVCEKSEIEWGGIEEERDRRRGGEETKQPRAFQVLVVPGRVVVRRSGPDRFLPLLPYSFPSSLVGDGILS